LKIIVTRNSLPYSEIEMETLGGESDEYFVGRSSNCHIQLNDPNIAMEAGYLKIDNNVVSYFPPSAPPVILNPSVRIGEFSLSIEPSVSTSKSLENAESQEQNNFLSPKEEVLDEFNFNDQLSNNFEEGLVKETMSSFTPVEMNEVVEQQELVGNKTELVSDFAKYYFDISGPKVPYDKYYFSQDKITIGRAQDNNIVLVDPEVSSHHASLSKIGTVIKLEDLNSVNGTFYEGDRINSVEILSGDAFQLGDTIFTLRVESDFINEEIQGIMPYAQEDDKTQDINLDDYSTKKSPESKSLFLKLKNFFSGKGFKLNKRVIMYGAVGLLLLIVMIPVENKEDVVLEEAPKSDTVKPQNGTASDGGVESKNDADPLAKVYTEEEKKYLNSHYRLALNNLEKGEYASAISEADLVSNIDPNYKDIVSVAAMAKEGLVKIEELERKKVEETERAVKRGKIKELTDKMDDAIKDKNLSLFESYLTQASEIDPDSSEVTNYKLQFESLKSDIEKIKEEELRKKEVREKMVEALSPGKLFFIQKEWYKAIIKLTDFLKIKPMDEDLSKEASEMLVQARAELDALTKPLLEDARQFANGDDLKNSYELYYKIIKIDPGNDEANRKYREYREKLTAKAMLIYRQGLVSESMSKFLKAKEKFQEVLLVAPSDSDYFRKADEKLKSLMVE
jgi:tetratricopeptide (TPR) repeat protein